MEGTNELSLHRVFSSLWDANKSWYALNSSLCCCKPSMFCSTEFAKVFPEEHRQFNSSEVFGEDGAPASLRWFSSNGRHSEKVYVCSTFGFVLGILRQNPLRQVQFLKMEHFKVVVSWINSFDLERGSVAPKAKNPPNTYEVTEGGKSHRGDKGTRTRACLQKKENPAESCRVKK